MAEILCVEDMKEKSAHPYFPFLSPFAKKRTDEVLSLLLFQHIKQHKVQDIDKDDSHRIPGQK